MVVYSVRQALRNGYPFRESGILNVARFVDLKDANKCAKRHFKTLCTPKTIKKVMKHRFGDMFFGSVANNDWKEEDVMVWVEKETRKKTVPDAFIQGFERAKSSVDNIANTVANPSSIGISSGAVLSADTDDNQAGITSDINPINQHVRDGRDFFGLVAAKKLHIDAGTLSGSLKKMEPLSPHEYFAQLDKRMNFIWRDWIKHWQNKTTKRFFGGKLQKDTATVPDSGEDASGEYSTNSHPLEGAHEVENGGSCVEVAVRDNPRAQVDAEYPNIENGQHNGEGVRKGSKTDIFLSKDEFRHAGSSGESEDDTRPILTPSSSVFGESAEVAKDEDKDGRFSEESGADSGPILTPSTSVFGEGSVRTEDESEDGESSEEAGDDRGTILTPSSVLGDDSVVAGEAAEDDGLREYSREGGSLLLTPTSSIFGDDGYLD
ncbi:hypothetical protein BDZ45DRAFT_668551 [Acephala macrosclerotiorum]|nr:hypothetical protein BDZ45DRAFT_668551 [Acephala macrosclerotiorum]